LAYRLLADALVLAHLAFIVFVLCGALLALRWPRVLWLHLPCAAWGVLVELAGWVCPLTPLENELRLEAGLSGYAGGFIEHYVIPAIYPDALTRPLQAAAGAFALAVNLVAYGLLLRRRARSASRANAGSDAR
jgi:Protein of Unknown function (DUF2784)